MTNKDAIKEISNFCECGIINRVEFIDALALTIKSLEQMDKVKMVTESEVREWASKEQARRFFYEHFTAFCREHGILIEEPKKVKKWKWWIKIKRHYGEGVVESIETTEKHYSFEEITKFEGMPAIWTKDESSMIEVEETKE